MAQTGSAAVEVVALPERDGPIARRLVEWFAPDHPEDWIRGFELAVALGTAGLPLLVHHADQQVADTRRRLLLLAAAAVGSGPAADPVLLDILQRTPRSSQAAIQERLIVPLAIALDGPRDGTAAVLGMLAKRGGLEPIEQTAIALAMARFDGGPRPPPSWYRSDEPAVVAAAWFAGAPPVQSPGRAWPDDVAELVRRGQLLGGSAPPVDPNAARRMIDWLSRPEVRLAAAVHLATAPDPAAWLDVEGLPIDGDVLAALAASPEFRAELFRRGLLDPPSRRLPDELRSRIAVAFALVADEAAIVRTASGWHEDEVAARSLSLALAWRSLVDPSAALPEDVIVLLPDVRETDWVRLACGLPPRAPQRPMPDPRLDVAFLLAVAPGDRLDRKAAAAAIEDALWRSGAHLAATRHDAEVALIHDLLLAGSTHGAQVLARGTDRRRAGLPQGLSEGNPAFEIGYAIYRFAREPGPKRPGWVRLRR